MSLVSSDQPQDANAKDRLQNIVGKYRDKIFGQIGGDYWENLFCWPTSWLNGTESSESCVQHTRNIFLQGWNVQGKGKGGKVVCLCQAA